MRERLLKWWDENWAPVHGWLPQELSVGVRFDRDCWPDDGFFRYTRDKGSRIWEVGPVEIWLEL